MLSINFWSLHPDLVATQGRWQVWPLDVHQLISNLEGSARCTIGTSEASRDNEPNAEIQPETSVQFEFYILESLHPSCSLTPSERLNNPLTEFSSIEFSSINSRLLLEIVWFKCLSIHNWCRLRKTNPETAEQYGCLRQILKIAYTDQR